MAVTLRDPRTGYTVVVTEEVEKYNLLSLGYFEVTPEWLLQRTADALTVLKDAAEGAKQEGENLADVTDTVQSAVNDSWLTPNEVKAKTKDEDK